MGVVHLDIAHGIVERVRAACAHLPEAEEGQSRRGHHWRIRGRTLADLVCVARPEGDITYVTFHCREEAPALLAVGHPFYPGWGGGLIAMVLTDDDTTDWDDLRELLTESYCLLAPKKLIKLLNLPG